MRRSGPLKRGSRPLKAKSGPPRVSKDRQAKLEGIGARGPLCGFVKTKPCAVSEQYGCDPCHLERVGKGFGDWKRIGGRWVGRVAPLIRAWHDVLDGNANARPYERRIVLRAATRAAAAVGEEWARDVGVDLAAESHPYDQWRALGSPGPGDMIE